MLVVPSPKPNNKSIKKLESLQGALLFEKALGSGVARVQLYCALHVSAKQVPNKQLVHTMVL